MYFVQRIDGRIIVPWETTFDEDAALTRAMGVFWAKGYQATSISDLVAAMGINKGSLYNTFGSKKELFTRAFLKYDRERRQALIARLDRLDDASEAIAGLFDALIAESHGDAERRGCLLVNTALELPNHPRDIQDIVSTAMDDFERFFERTLRVGQQRGQVSTELDPSEAATSLLALAVGLRVLARGPRAAGALDAIRKQAVESISA